MTAPATTLGRSPNTLFGGWEVGLLIMMVLLYVAGAVLNPTFFGSTDAFQALLRDSSRYAVMAVGMTFVIAPIAPMPGTACPSATGATGLAAIIRFVRR